MKVWLHDHTAVLCRGNHKLDSVKHAIRCQVSIFLMARARLQDSWPVVAENMLTGYSCCRSGCLVKKEARMQLGCTSMAMMSSSKRLSLICSHRQAQSLWVALCLICPCFDMCSCMYGPPTCIYVCTHIVVCTCPSLPLHVAHSGHSLVRSTVCSAFLS